MLPTFFYESDIVSLATNKNDLYIEGFNSDDNIQYEPVIIKNCGSKNNIDRKIFAPYSNIVDLPHICNYIKLYNPNNSIIYSNRGLLMWFSCCVSSIGKINLYTRNPYSWQTNIRLTTRDLYNKFYKYRLANPNMYDCIETLTLLEKHLIFENACRYGYIEYVKHIIDNYGKFFDHHYMNEFSFRIACMRNHFEIAMLLKKKFPNMCNMDKKYNSELIKKCESQEIIEWLKADCPLNNTKSARKI